MAGAWGGMESMRGLRRNGAIAFPRYERRINQMKPGTFIRLPDGREGTVVYHGLEGYGIIWGRQIVDVEAILLTTPLFTNAPTNGCPEPEALLRKPYRDAYLECVGEEYEVILDD
jgi:hypothetical protein